MGFPITDAESANIAHRITAPAELVVAAAVRVAGVVVMVERPGRHGDCISAAGRISGDRQHGGEHGFLTSHGRFVNRKEAGDLVQATGQGSPSDRITSGHLFSEDLWNDPKAQPNTEEKT